MLAFLIGTTILNLFLGYALAVYLMRASQDAEYRPQPRPADRSGAGEATSGLFADAAETSSATMSVQATTGSQTATTVAAGGTTAEEAASARTSNAAAPLAADGTAPATAMADAGDDAVARTDGAEELDQQLLAGIADFRSQLAKLRSETGQPEEGKRRPVARK